jgi:hypothetical protein
MAGYLFNLYDDHFMKDNSAFVFLDLLPPVNQPGPSGHMWAPRAG